MLLAVLFSIGSCTTAFAQSASSATAQKPDYWCLASAYSAPGKFDLEGEKLGCQSSAIRYRHSPDKKYIAFIVNNGAHLIVSDAASGKAVFTAQAPPPSIIKGFCPSVLTGLSWAPDSRRLTLYGHKSPKVVAQTVNRPGRFSGHSVGIRYFTTSKHLSTSDCLVSINKHAATFCQGQPARDEVSTNYGH
jgi:hypothetical protein